MVAVLASPRFLFHIETAEPVAAGQTYARIDEYTLASRLSFALWCSIPDEELLGLAGKGELRQDIKIIVNLTARFIDRSRALQTGELRSGKTKFKLFF